MGKNSVRQSGPAKAPKPNRGGRVVTIGGGAGADAFSESEASDDDCSEEEEEGRRWSDDSDEETGSEGGEGEDGEAGESEESEDDAAATAEEKAAKAKKRASTRLWEAKHFVEKISGAKGTIYKTQLLPEMTFHTHETFVQFLKGDRFQKLLAECRKGMRTYNDNERLKQKAQARRTRAEQRRAVTKRERRVKRKGKVQDIPETEIGRRKEAFQAKKARRLARKEVAAKALG